MDEEWDDTPPTSYNSEPAFVDRGRSFGAGRGFVPFEQPSSVNNSNDEWNDNQNSFGNDDSYSGGRGGGRGRGRGGRGGGRGRGGFDSRNGDSGYRGRRDDDDNGGGYKPRRRDDDDNGGGYKPRRRDDDDDDGGYKPRRRNDDDGDSGYKPRRRNDDDDGGYKPRRNNDENAEKGEGDGEPEKKVERYIPPDPTEDEDEMFGTSISSGINFEKYENIQVKVSGENCPEAITSFETSGLREYVKENIRKSGYKKPTPVQKNAIPIIMAGRDLMACAQTGSGKTAAFLLPIVHTLLNDPRDQVLTSTCVEPQALIIAPTRELAIQIHSEARKFAHGSILRTNVSYGGVVSGHQKRQLLNGCHILVATPGRLQDFIDKGYLSLGSIRFLVLDEADRMLDMGFLPCIEKLLSNPSMVPTGERQTLLFSATFPEEIQHLAAKFLHNYVFLVVGIVGGACADVEQCFHLVQRNEKRTKLMELLREQGNNLEKTLVFVEMKRIADFIAAFLSDQDIPTTSIHGDRLQREREIALADFKSGRMPVLVATAVAARGLDIKGVAHVINYDLPKTIDEYVHRIGRTGRVGNRGKATSFFEPGTDGPLARDLVKILRQAEQPVPDYIENEVMGGVDSGFSGGQGRGFGGRDVRKFDQGGNDNSGGFGGGAQNEPEEEW